MPDHAGLRTSDRSYGNRIFEGTAYKISLGICQNVGWSSRKGHHIAQTLEVGSFYQYGDSSGGVDSRGRVAPFSLR